MGCLFGAFVFLLEGGERKLSTCGLITTGESASFTFCLFGVFSSFAGGGLSFTDASSVLDLAALGPGLTCKHDHRLIL